MWLHADCAQVNVELPAAFLPECSPEPAPVQPRLLDGVYLEGSPARAVDADLG